ncbi:MAG: sigma-70 family RNA polymerase sigma factor [Fibrobacteria bacterium]|nr:sigma-70 family RNA polymerase sigma factor [Fibrobacteria bacterium]
MAIDIKAYYEKYGPMVLRRCRFMLKDEERARDAMQDTFVKLLKKEHELKDQYPSSLLYRIATNTCLNIIRSRSRRPETQVDAQILAIANYEEPESSWLAKDILARLFGGEKESTRTIAVLHYLDGMTLEEVSKHTGLSVSGVRKRLRNLRKHVHELEGVSL